jgi:HD-like signal output (HDOD) protein
VTGFAAIRTRIRQAITHATSSKSPTVPSNLRRLLVDDAWEGFTRLAAADQRHLIDVATRLADQGNDLDLVTAGLLHDIGKAISEGSIHLVDRVVYVLLPRPFQGWAGRYPKHIITRGVAALYHHPNRGADLVLAWGYPDRVAWLIRHHERRDIDDPQLQSLIVADDTSDGTPRE